MDLLIRHATIVSDGVEVQADLGITNGRVSQIGRLEGSESAHTIEAPGRVILPGLVDLGVSLEAEGEFYPATKQSIDSITQEALTGGVTSLFLAHRFDDAKPFPETFAQRRQDDTARAWVDFGYHYFVDEWTDQRRRHMKTALAGAISSVWISRAGTGRATGPALAHAVLRELGPDSFAVTSVSDPTFESFLRADLAELGHVTPSHYPGVFPEWVESAALRTLGSALRATRSRLLVSGLTGPQSLAELQTLRDAGVPIHGGIKLAHLCLNGDQFDEGELATERPFPWPPMRGRAEQQSLWHALENGLATFVTSGHHPRTQEEVEAAKTDCTRAKGGTTALSHTLQLLHSEGVAKWRLSLESLSICGCADPAKLAGLYPRKGALQIGSDADFVILDPTAVDPLPAAGRALGHHDPFAGMAASGAVQSVYLRGRMVYADGKFFEPGGAYLDGRVSLA